MKNIRCGKCGLVNWPDAVECKRCGLSLVALQQVPSVFPRSPSSKKLMFGIVIPLLIVGASLWSLALRQTTDIQASKNTSKPLASIPERAKPVNDLIPRGPYIHGGSIQTTYDRFYNYTSISLESMSVSDESAPDKLDMAASFIYEGRPLTANDVVTIRFISTTEDWKYLKFRAPAILTDGARLDLSDGAMRYDNHIGGGYVMEFISLDLPYEAFLKLINAKTVEIKIGTTEFALSSNHLIALQDLASRTQK